MMMLHNELRYYASLAQGIKRAVGMQGDDEGTSRVSETLQPTFDVFRRSEQAIYRGERLYSWNGYVNPGGAFIVQSMLQNPTGSRRILVLESWQLATTAGGATSASMQIAIGMGSSSPLSQTGGGLGQSHLDALGTPGMVTQVPPFTLTYDNGVAGVGIIANMRYAWVTAALVPTVFKIPVVVRPGQNVLLQGQTNNVGLYWTVAGYHREALPGEL